ncbi:Tn3 family transposase [Nonomuraea sp. MG754425]|uniref:Tn3 family transposase n=1 Tax=Nonomuraea sp. MG754425 TaxID=2570319 RepID=UPI00235135B8|nr:Tn3 family transposase [Nonomuraea sp. MG754425]
MTRRLAGHWVAAPYHSYGRALPDDQLRGKLHPLRSPTSIREGELLSITLLRRLRPDSKRNKIYRAFRELGRVKRAMVLLRYISD